MPRFARQHAPGALFHVISRISAREFRIGDAERANYLDRVEALLRQTDWQPIAYAIMSDHVHWGLVGGCAPLDTFVRPLHVGFALWLNQMQGRFGSVFSARPKLIQVPWNRCAQLVAYLHNNPVRAQVAQAAIDSTWTSHASYVGVSRAARWLDVDQGLRRCGFDSTAGGRLDFDRFVVLHAAARTDPELTGANAIRARTKVRRLLGPSVEITGPVLHDNQTEYGVEVPEATRPMPTWKGNPLEIVDAVARRRAVPPHRIRSKERARDVVAARQLVLAVGVRLLGRPTTEMAAVVGISISSASKLVRAACGRDSWDTREATAVAEELRLGSAAA